MPKKTDEQHSYPPVTSRPGKKPVFVKTSTIRPDQRPSFVHETLRHQDFSRKKLLRFSAVACRFEDSRFDNSHIDHGGFGDGREQSVYVNCSFDGSRIRFVYQGNTRFEMCSFRNVRLREWMGSTLELVNCVFSGRLTKGTFSGKVGELGADTGRERNEFRGNDFEGIELDDVSFSGGIDLTLQRLPTGRKYLYLTEPSPVVYEVYRKVLGWGDLEERRVALILMHILRKKLDSGQKQLFIPRSSFGSGKVEDKVFEMLRAESSRKG